MNPENVKGPTTAFCTVSPFKSRFHRWWEAVILKSAPVATELVREQRFLHHAYFLRVSPRQLKRAQIAVHQRMKSGVLLFISAYNGSAEIYFRGFSKDLFEPMDRIWGCCKEWKGARPYENLNEFIRAHRRPAQFYFNAYTEKSDHLRAALRFRSELDALIAERYDDPEAFLAGYLQLAQSTWGGANAKGTQ